MGENIRDGTITIGTAAVQLSLQQKPGARTALSIINTSTAGQNISLAWGKNAIDGNGIVLYPGGSWCESIDSKFTPSDMEVWAVATAAGGTIAIHERVRTGGQ